MNFGLFASLKGLVWQISDYFVLITGWDGFPQKCIGGPRLCADCRAESHACKGPSTVSSPLVLSQQCLCILIHYTVLDQTLSPPQLHFNEKWIITGIIWMVHISAACSLLCCQPVQLWDVLLVTITVCLLGISPVLVQYWDLGRFCIHMLVMCTLLSHEVCFICVAH